MPALILIDGILVYSLLKMLCEKSISSIDIQDPEGPTEVWIALSICIGSK